MKTRVGCSLLGEWDRGEGPTEYGVGSSKLHLQTLVGWGHACESRRHTVQARTQAHNLEPRSEMLTWVGVGQNFFQHKWYYISILRMTVKIQATA